MASKSCFTAFGFFLREPRRLAREKELILDEDAELLSAWLSFVSELLFDFCFRSWPGELSVVATGLMTLMRRDCRLARALISSLPLNP